MATARKQQAGIQRNSIGKDELNLADWQIGVATHQQILRSTSSDGKKIDYIEYRVPRAGRGDQKVTLMAPAVIGLPTPLEEDLVIGLIQLSRDQDNFASDTVYFTPSQLFSVIRWTNAGKNLTRLEESLTRLRALTITYELVWFDVEKHEVDDKIITGIIGEARLVRRRGRKASGEHLSYFHWEPRFHKSLQAGNLTNLDLDLYFSLDRPTTKRLLRHLNKRFYGPRERQRYERSLTHLACGHLGLSKNKDLKRNLQRAIDELEKREYITPLPPKERFIKVGTGEYRVVFDLHPARFTRPRAASTAAKPSDEARTLVTTYHEYRFKRTSHEPREHELEKAAELLAKYDAELLFKVLSEAAAKTESSYKGDDIHFGAAAAILERLAEERLKRIEQHRRNDLKMAVQRSEADQAEIARVERIKRHKALQQAWESLTDDRKQAYVDQAIANAKSRLERDSIKKRDLNEPFVAVLELFANEK